MSPAATAAATTLFAAAATVAAPTAPFRACVRLPLRGGPGAPRRAVTSMAVSTPRSAAAASFLERRESERALHFVKYQGLGNDFIMVRVFRFFFFLCVFGLTSAIISRARGVCFGGNLPLRIRGINVVLYAFG